MAVNLRTLLMGVSFFFSATVNGLELQAQQVGDCKLPRFTWLSFMGLKITKTCAGIAWYTPQLRTPPETCIDVVNMHPGLDLATFLSLNPAIHPYCDNMLVGHAVCIRAARSNDCPKPAEPTPQQQSISPKQPQSNTTPKPQETSSTTSNGWHWETTV
jgi:hypothetical protein